MRFVEGMLRFCWLMFLLLWIWLSLVGIVLISGKWYKVFVLNLFLWECGLVCIDYL